MIYHNSFICSLVNGLDFVLCSAVFAFLTWTIIGVWKIIETTFSEGMALVIFSLMSILLILFSYI